MPSIATLAPVIVLAGLALVTARVCIGRGAEQHEAMTADVRDRALEDLPPDLRDGLTVDEWDELPAPGTGPRRRREDVL